jgi:hypothetical protein
LSPGWSAFLSAAQQYSAVLHIVIEGPNTGVGIGAKDVARLATLGASLDVDAYGVMSDEGDYDA